MSFEPRERPFETLEHDEEVVAEFVASLDNCHLQMIGMAVNNELALRSEGKPECANLLH